MKESPLPVKMTLSPITNLFKESFLNHIPLKSDKPDGEMLNANLLKSFYSVTLDTYCDIVLGAPCPVPRSCSIWNDCSPDLSTCVDDESNFGFHCQNICLFVVGEEHQRLYTFTDPGVEVTVSIPKESSNCQLRVFAVGGGGRGGDDGDYGGGGSGYLTYREVQVSGPSEVKLTVGGAEQSSTVKVNGETIRAHPGQDFHDKNGGSGFSGGGASRKNGGSNGGDGDSNSNNFWPGSGGEGTGEDVTSYSMDHVILTPGKGGSPRGHCDGVGGGGGGVLVNGDGPGKSKPSWKGQGQGYGGGGSGNSRYGEPGVIILQIGPTDRNRQYLRQFTAVPSTPQTPVVPPQPENSSPTSPELQSFVTPPTTPVATEPPRRSTHITRKPDRLI